MFQQIKNQAIFNVAVNKQMETLTARTRDELIGAPSIPVFQHLQSRSAYEGKGIMAGESEQ